MNTLKYILGFLVFSLISCSSEKQEDSNLQDTADKVETKKEVIIKKKLKVTSELLSKDKSFSSQLLLADSLQMKRKLKNGEFDNYSLQLHDLLVKSEMDTLAYFSSKSDQLTGYKVIGWFKNDILFYTENGPKTVDKYLLFDPVKKESYLLDYWSAEKLSNTEGLKDKSISFNIESGKVTSIDLK
ncbi:hypothetical protein [Sediminitomix flava]|uniref:Uncharacterized protein n=1 Tax=Sediminitomix flava TaxID=379075 RepID=A0A315Z642_SEDFL|nr:hypothetical protein [Sediminitomix flava]PWJ39337.1 hypothetical protein BC781_106238 [Sediminitomix flava]